jgi:PAS domain-containing protein
LPRLFGAFSLVAIAIAFWYGGIGPGLLAVLLSSFAFYFFLFPVTEIRGPGWQSFLVIYAVLGGLAGWFSASRRRAERLLAEARDGLERRAAERTRELAQANEELKSTEDALRHSEDYLRLVIDTVPALIHTGRPDGYLDYFNRRWLDYVGLPLEGVAGWKWTEVNHPDDVAATLENWRGSIATGEPLRIGRGSGSDALDVIAAIRGEAGGSGDVRSGFTWSHRHGRIRQLSSSSPRRTRRPHGVPASGVMRRWYGLTYRRAYAASSRANPPQR